MITNKHLMRKYKRTVNNKMRYFGDTDIDKGIMRVNKKKSKKAGSGEVLDTIVHEVTHARYPKMNELKVRRKTKRTMDNLSRLQKQKYYKMFA